MKDDLFFIAPSESMLIGLCLEEYLRLRREDEATSFFTVSHARIDPFMPELTRVRINRIAESAIPDDLQWLPIEDMRIGRHSSEPNTYYGIDEQGAYRKKIEPGRSFLDLLTQRLAPHLGVAEWMRPLMEGDDSDITAFADELLVGIANDEDQNPASVGIRGNADNPVEIERSILSLVEYNEAQRFFKLGRCFGGLIAGMQLYETKHALLLSLPTIGRFLADLLNMPEVDRSAVAKNALSSIGGAFDRELKAFCPVWKLLARSIEDGHLDLGRLSELGDLTDEERAAIAKAFDEKQGQQRREAVLPLIPRLWPAVWVAFGEILGEIRELDQNAKEQDASSVTPRPFVVGPNETPDRIRQWLQEYERELAHGASAGTPEKVVNGLKDSPEALAKRLWMEEYNARYRATRGGFPSLLLDILSADRSTILERRFAQIALSLYKGYRNEVTHEYDRFQCTTAEARYFIAGVRVLLELYGEIVVGRQK